MHQDAVPLRATTPFQVANALQKNVYTVPCLPEHAVAVEAEDPSHHARRVVVVDVLSRALPADGADVPLVEHHLVALDLVNAVAASQVVVPGAAVQPLDGLFAARVV